MSTNIKKRKFKWFRIKVLKRIEILEGEDLVNELEDILEEINSKKLDQIIFFQPFIRQLRGLLDETKAKPKKKGRQYDPFHIPRSGDGRVVLFGLSNVGKSTLMNAITNTDVKTGDFLHTTRTALAGTCEHNKLKIQIIDVPGFLDFKEDWAISRQIVRVARTCDAILLVVDLSMDIDRQYTFLMNQLENANLLEGNESSYKMGIIATKGDLPGSKDNFEKLKSITTLSIHPITIQDNKSLEKLKDYLFSVLEVIRVYTKPPRREPNLKRPFICPIETTISELVEKIHNDFLKFFQYARVWGNSVEFSGKRVGLDHTLMDSDIVEVTVNRR